MLRYADARGPVLSMLLAFAVAGCDQVGDVASGAGTATKNLANKISGGNESKTDEDPTGEVTAAPPETSQSDAGVIGGSDPETAEEADAEQQDEPEPEPAQARSDDFRLVFEMSHQSCASCGIWFDSAELVIVHSDGTFSARQSGSLLIKEAPYHQGRFEADISAIPDSSTIESATLYMHLNVHEGIANDDYTSSISVFGYIDGERKFVREITARHDIKGKGYSKANPVVPVDFSNYARKI